MSEMKPLKLVEIVLDKPRHLALTIRAQFLIEDRINKSRGVPLESPIPFLLIVKKALQQNEFYLLPLDLLHVALWACLLHEDPSLGFDAVSDLMVDINLINRKIVEVFAARYGKADEDDVEEASPESPLSLTGANSGVSPGSG